MELIWKKIDTSDLPERGKRVLLCANDSFPVPDVAVASLMLDVPDEYGIQPPDVYWDVEGDQQYSVNEHWTHWANFELPPRN